MNILRNRFASVALVVFLVLAAALYFSYQPSSEVYGEVFTHAITTKKVVALTFDDGPNGDATRQVLDVLKKENVTATFFLVGDNVKYYPDVAKQIVADGNEVGNHTSHHIRLLPFEDSKDIQTDLLATDAEIFQATGQTPKFFRPPFGFRTPWILKAAEKIGLIPTTWNDQAHDYKYGNPVTIENKILAGVRPGGIIVLHDGFETRHDVQYPALIQSLPRIIEVLKQRGYSFVTLSQLYAINNGE